MSKYAHILEHLEDCTKFNGLELEDIPTSMQKELICIGCGEVWIINNNDAITLKNGHQPDWNSFVTGANMMSHFIKDGAKSRIYNTEEYKKELMEPIFGFDLDYE